jgi:phage terminase large subunit-like protein
MQSVDHLKELHDEIHEKAIAIARNSLSGFSQYLHLDHDVQWFHKLVYSYLERWVNKDIKKLAIFMPPQHGKSQMSSKNVPAYILGKNPKAKIVVASYTQTVSSNFCRGTQDIMDNPSYRKVFPKTMLPSKFVDRTNELRNSTYFETVKYKGSYKSVGVGGSLTSFTTEYGIIDDPIKDRKEANSAVYRERLWDWYTDVFRTRLNNESCELLLFTRWHNDDIAGRLFDPLNEHYDPKEAAKWTVIVIPALKELEKAIPQQIEIKDPRKVDDALWPTMHSKEKHEDDRRTNPIKFASLKQQRPSPLGGTIIKKEGFVYLDENEVPFNPEETPMHFMIDGAFTDKTENDPSALIAYRVHGKNIYIYNCHSVRLTLDKFLPYVNKWLLSMGYTDESMIKIEAKASGFSFIQMLRQPEYGAFNVNQINTKHVGMGKINRAESASPTVASEKVHLIKGSWNAAFVGQVTNFPNDTHDDMLDLLCYVVLDNMEGIKGRVYKTNVKLAGQSKTSKIQKVTR